MNLDSISYNAERIYKRLFYKIGKSEHYIISYPKTGRTWLRYLLGNYIIDQYSLSQNFIGDTDYLCWKAKIPKIKFRHSGSFVYSSSSDLAIDFESKSKSFASKKLVFLTRNPYDTLVSSYYHYKYREGKYLDDISSFVRDDFLGIPRFVSFHNAWHDRIIDSERTLLISYEEMKESAEKVLKSVLMFFDFNDVNLQRVKFSVSKSSFDNMRKIEVTNRKNDFLTKIGSDVTSMKTRKGKVGGYLKELKQEDIDYISDYIESNQIK